MNTQHTTNIDRHATNIQQANNIHTTNTHQTYNKHTTNIQQAYKSQTHILNMIEAKWGSLARVLQWFCGECLVMAMFETGI